jgi:signal peptidase II
LIYYPIIACVILSDQFLKRAVTTRLLDARGMRLRFIPGLFDIVYVENTGAAFGILQGKRAFLIAFMALLLAALLVYIFMRRKSESPVLLAGLSLVVGGGLGNLIDRVRLGYVVDYLEFQPFSFPVFNLADISVCAGCGLMLLQFAVAELRARGRKGPDGSVE